MYSVTLGLTYKQRQIFNNSGHDQLEGWEVSLRSGLELLLILLITEEDGNGVRALDVQKLVVSE